MTHRYISSGCNCSGSIILFIMIIVSRYKSRYFVSGVLRNTYRSIVHNFIRLHARHGQATCINLQLGGTYVTIIGLSVLFLFYFPSYLTSNVHSNFVYYMHFKLRNAFFFNFITLMYKNFIKEKICRENFVLWVFCTVVVQKSMIYLWNICKCKEKINLALSYLMLHIT
jgi:hypothetical protein